MAITFPTARLFDRYGFEIKENADMNRVLDHVRRSFKPEKGELKIKSLTNRPMASLASRRFSFSGRPNWQRASRAIRR